MKRRNRKGSCEISRLPEELLSAALSRSLATPQEAARAAIVSRAFRAAADSDHAWSSFLPGGDLPSWPPGSLMTLRRRPCPRRRCSSASPITPSSSLTA
nr:unnamed protein product [Digitaria exilis]